MHRWLTFLSILAAILLSACARTRQTPLEPGETVEAVWCGDSQWQSGQKAVLAARLRTISTGEQPGQLLDFAALPEGTTPVAKVEFLSADDSVVQVSEVRLTHRC